MTNEFFRLKTEELLNEILQVKTFIKKHNPTIGVLTEEILRRFLATYLHKGIAVEQGFVIDEKSNLSRQIDIIIYDNQLYSPLYRVNDIVVVPSKSVLAVIEVKTTVNSKTAFHEIIKYFASVSQILDYRTEKHLFIYNASSASKLDDYFHNYKHPGSYQKFDHDTFQNLPETITGIKSSYHLRKSGISFQRDAAGYMSYNYADKTNNDISSLELFFKNIHSKVFSYNLEKTHIDFREDRKFNITDESNLKSIIAIELFNL
ncbi:DUF6602 domain-containing protein [Flavobacterium sp. 140616W15]|uniref:DUF6602 domain-containing protein n=1 Tax=Flavobacterium sp. 140616W15 TaxID=2478552 RepID=UPI000F0CD520|nr:DUF6602 domain-containing protein [Flavobacterium sp. 140616W15]AYN03603.1 hypothetical protein EAG11_05030 [Flavobacterium sp. 140616W15]